MFQLPYRERNALRADRLPPLAGRDALGAPRLAKEAASLPSGTPYATPPARLETLRADNPNAGREVMR